MLACAMARKIGPTGHYPLGEPLEPSDQGHMEIAFSIVPPHHAKMEFGTYLDWFFLTPPVAHRLTTTLRKTLTSAYGRVRPKESVPYVVECNMERGVVMVALPHLTSQITATAEVWLALVDRIDAERRKLSL